MVVEAFACGMPVISSDSGELPYVVLDAGVIVGERDEDAWVSAISELIGDPAKRSELSLWVSPARARRMRGRW